MKQKIRLGLLFGGRSAEHEVSLVTARNVYEALDKDKYDITLVGIDKSGAWHLPSSEQLLLSSKTVKTAKLPRSAESVQVTPYTGDKQLTTRETSQTVGTLDVVFPLLHGPFGEDGTVQGLLKLMGVPYVGADVLGSALGMDKDVMKRLLRDAGLPIVPFITVQEHERDKLVFSEIEKKLGLPLFVKPANLGSSVGVSKVSKEEEFKEALDEAFKYDRKILVEKGIDAREIECSVLGNEEKLVSILGEILPTHEFYDYEAKYIDEKGASLRIPAELTKDQVELVQNLAIKACATLCIEGMARVDFFLERGSDKFYINEINTIPGFTTISMYPKLWEASGISYPELIDRLIQLAIDRHKRDRDLRTQR